MVREEEREVREQHAGWSLRGQKIHDTPLDVEGVVEQTLQNGNMADLLVTAKIQ